MFSNTLKTFKSLTKNPGQYLESHNDVAEKIRNSLKDIYDFIQENSVDHKKKILPKLIIDNFDDEQIWQELEMWNAVKYDECFKNVANLLAKKEKLAFPLIHPTDYVEEAKDNDCEPEDSASWDALSDKNLEPETKPKPGLKRKLKASVVDDKFFKLSELEEFLNMEEKGQQNEKHVIESESLDLFKEIASDEEREEGLFYKEFFDPPHEDEAVTWEDESFVSKEDKAKEDNNKRKKRLRFDLPEPSEESEGAEESTNRPKSQFEMRQERLQSRIASLEEVAMSEKPWQMQGEVSGGGRPPNSLLEEVLEFDMTTRPPPVVTEQTTMKLEDIILQRIKDKAWDDVERKVKPVLGPDEYKKRIVMDQEKSKLSLAEVYEQDYLKEKKKDSVDVDAEERPKEEPQEHTTIRSMMSSVFAKLDALTNYHYTPKMIMPEVKIVSNLPAVMMEEVTPVAASDGTLLAPQEIKAKRKRDLIGRNEMTKHEINRARKLRRKRQRMRQLENKRVAKMVDRLKPGLGNKYSKERAMEAFKKLGRAGNIEVERRSGKPEVRSSATFFRQLQEEKSVAFRPKANKALRQK